MPHAKDNIQCSPTSYNGHIIAPTSHSTTHGVTSFVHIFNTITYLLAYLLIVSVRISIRTYNVIFLPMDEQNLTELTGFERVPVISQRVEQFVGEMHYFRHFPLTL